MQLATREVLELAERCFSVAGFDEGPARAVAETVWWTELYRGSGLETLHDLLPALPAWDRTTLRFEDRSEFVSVVDADGQPGLVSSAPTVDLASAAASRHGVGIVRATGAADDATVPMLGHTTYAAAERGFLSIVLATDGADRHRTVLARPEDPHPHLVERELDVPSAGHTALSGALRAGVTTRRDNPLTQAFFIGDADTAFGTAGERMLNRLLHRAVESGGTDGVGPGFILVCLNPDHPRHTGGLRRVVDQFVRDERFTRTFPPTEIRARVETLLQEGVTVEDAVWRGIFDRSSEVLAPEFEGSYRGAGFNINE
jgi:LDH2 family malate/lactate/ureidoglycolate dehydrogenase